MLGWNHALDAVLFTQQAVVVRGVEPPRDSCPIVSVKSTVPEVHFDRQRYESLKGADLHEFFIGMLEEGLKKCAMHHEIPTEFLFSSIREFREGGYKNEWVHHKKLFRPHGIRTELRCCLTMSEFRLTFAATKKGGVIYEKCIFETKPDEICFAHKFKEVKLLDDNFVVVAAFADPLFSLPLADLLDT